MISSPSEQIELNTEELLQSKIKSLRKKIADLEESNNEVARENKSLLYTNTQLKLENQEQNQMKSKWLADNQDLARKNSELMAINSAANEELKQFNSELELQKERGREIAEDIKNQALLLDEKLKEYQQKAKLADERENNILKREQDVNQKIKILKEVIS